MLYEVRLLGGLVERAGRPRVQVELAAPATVGELRAAVADQHPTLAPLLGRVTVAVDLEVARDADPVPADAEVALLPPVAGGAGGGDAASGATGASGDGERARVLADGRRVLTGLRPAPLDVDGALAAVTGPAAGGTVAFVGTVRDHAPDLAAPVARLDYEAYPEMAERVLATIADEQLAAHRDLLGIALLHTVGRLRVGEHTILVGAAAAHREAAFVVCRDALEAVKDRVPIFKREVTADGGHRWVGLPGPG